jgi:hypothetical protein
MHCAGVMRESRRGILGVWALGSIVGVACVDRELVKVPPAVQSGVTVRIVTSPAADVDLLVLVDNSNSMREEQANLTANFGSLVRSLVDPPDEDGDGFPDWNPAESLHVGVISSDMGTSGYPITTCDDAERGDDGVLQSLPSTKLEGCDPTYPSFLTFEQGDDAAAFASDFECVATLGTGGCGFEQQLGAMEKAITVHSADGAANDGFLRPEAILAILLVTDEEDCTISDPTIFGDDDSLGLLNLRCFENPEMVRPVAEFVNAAIQTKAGHPERLVVAAIAGVPPDLVDLSEGQLTSDDVMDRRTYERILNDPRMTETVDFSPEGGGNRLVPSCDVPGLGVAFPPRRIVEWVRDVEADGGSGVVQSICQADWQPTMRAISRLIGGVLHGACLARPLSGPGGVPLATGEHADCIVREELTHAGACPAGRFQVAETEDGNTICQVCQAGDGEDPFLVDSVGTSLSACADSAAHWYYTTEDEQCGGKGKVQFTEGNEPEPGTVVDLQCLSEVSAE